MKRCIAIVLLLLVGGAVVNVAVAWGIALAASFGDTKKENEMRTARIDGRVWHVEVWDYGYSGRATMWFRFPTEPSIGQAIPVPKDAETNRQNIRWIRRHSSRPFMYAHFEVDDNLVSAFVLEQGWPCRAMFSAMSVPWHNYGYEAILSGYDTGLYHDNPLGWPPRLLPLRPLWPGFIINTLFYAAILWLLFAAPFTVRRALRRRRGQCEKCAYPIGTSPVCTECGAVLPQRKRTEP